MDDIYPIKKFGVHPNTDFDQSAAMILVEKYGLNVFPGADSAIKNGQFVLAYDGVIGGSWKQQLKKGVLWLERDDDDDNPLNEHRNHNAEADEGVSSTSLVARYLDLNIHRKESVSIFVDHANQTDAGRDGKQDTAFGRVLKTMNRFAFLNLSQNEDSRQRAILSWAAIGLRVAHDSIESDIFRSFDIIDISKTIEKHGNPEDSKYWLGFAQAAMQIEQDYFKNITPRSWEQFGVVREYPDASGNLVKVAWVLDCDDPLVVKYMRHQSSFAILIQQNRRGNVQIYANTRVAAELDLKKLAIRLRRAELKKRGIEFDGIVEQQLGLGGRVALAPWWFLYKKTMLFNGSNTIPKLEKTALSFHEEILSEIMAFISESVVF